MARAVHPKMEKPPEKPAPLETPAPSAESASAPAHPGQMAPLALAVMIKQVKEIVAGFSPTSGGNFMFIKTDDWIKLRKAVAALPGPTEKT